MVFFRFSATRQAKPPIQSKPMDATTISSKALVPLPPAPTTQPAQHNKPNTSPSSSRPPASSHSMALSHT